MKLSTLFTLILTICISKVHAQLQGTEVAANYTVYKGTFVVNGDKDSFYPVVFKYCNQDRINHLKIYRSYGEAGPDELSPTHKGGLTLEIDVNYGGWGGSTYDWRINDLRQSYHETFANASHSMHSMGFTIWLRGGGFVYHYESDYAANLQVAYNNDVIFSDPNHPEWTPVTAGPPLSTPNRETIANHLLSLTFAKQGSNAVYTSGNVLVGKTTQNNAAYKLDVAGKVRADEVTVNTTGADFVFEEGYSLRPLHEVEAFIKENGHLPDIAPAKTMQENGMGVGEMNAKLLQKVEELTLYLIEKNKRIEELQKQVNDIKQQLKNNL